MSDARSTPVDLDAVYEFARWLGDERRDLAILGEGNVSIRTGPERMRVKASGASLAETDERTMVEIWMPPVIGLLDEAGVTDSDVEDALLSSRVDSKAPAPSVETLLHAVALTAGGASVVAHSHPQSVNAILCSDRAAALVEGALFPDQIVVLGRRQILLPYLDPGLELARAAKRELEQFRLDSGGDRARAIYLTNHGFVALGASVSEARRITQMADKSARILHGALAVGRAVSLSESDSDRIHTRPDEQLRRRVLDQSIAAIDRH